MQAHSIVCGSVPEVRLEADPHAPLFFLFSHLQSAGGASKKAKTTPSTVNGESATPKMLSSKMYA